MLVGRLPCLRLTRSSHCNRKQSCARGRGLNQLAALECTSPLKHLVRVQSMSTCNQRHARAWLQCQIYDLPLLCNRPKSANPTSRARYLFHDHIVRLKLAEMPEGKTTRLRMRGGTPMISFKNAGHMGLSPHARGNLAAASACRVVEGSIPACAGEPLADAGSALGARVYPRMRGGTTPYLYERIRF